MSKTCSIAKKELWSYFSSPIAFIFLGSYLLISMFTFFWVEKFFSRNIADLRPLFEWMPILLIFLVSTLTMKMWSEERRMGTVEFLLTLPVKSYELVLGKFLACISLVGIALLLTSGLAISVGILGNMDWGPAIGAYLASLLLASAYTAIGLYVSSKTDSQIISLITTAVLCFIFYIIGSNTLVNFFSNKGGEILKLMGTGSRFNSISRGMLDFRDIYYYLSLTGIFLTLNVFSLEKLKWSVENLKANHRSYTLGITLLLLNLALGNVWLNKVVSARVDITSSRMYSISDATKEIIASLEEPLLLRGYFSANTHPLLAPHVPTIRDLLAEYQIASKGKIRAEFVDPLDNSELEAELNKKYNIEPIPFQVPGRHSVSMVNSYFNILVQYGSQFEVMDFNSLIEIKHDSMGNIEVQLRNLEYDISKAIKKVMQGFKNTDNVFANLKHPVKFVGYVSEGKLPKQVVTLLGDIKKAVEEMAKTSDGKLEVDFQDPSTDEALAKRIAENYGFEPQSMSLFAQDTFYFYLTLQDGDKVISLGIPDDLSVAKFKTSFEAALKRAVPGFLRTVGVVNPPSNSNPMMAQFGGGNHGAQYKGLQQKLGENYSSQPVELESGTIPGEVDILLVLAPKNLNEKQVFAIDQFLMKGGTVVLATSPVTVQKSQTGFNSELQESGLEKWLEHFGVNIPKELVLDEQNAGFPAIRKRNVQGVTIREPYLAPYPFFIDVRENGFNSENAITSTLGQLTMAWASPILVDANINKERKVTPLIKSSAGSWRATDTSIEANRDLYPDLGFPEGEKKEQNVLATIVEGKFESYFKGKESPLLKKDKAEKKKEGEEAEEKHDIVTSVIDKSSDTSRIIIFASNEFIADDTLQMASMINGSQYVNSLQVVENSLDWSTQDKSLLSIRSRSHFARTLKPLKDEGKRNWELLNYAFALLGLLGVFLIYRVKQRKAGMRFRQLNLS